MLASLIEPGRLEKGTEVVGEKEGEKGQRRRGGRAALAGVAGCVGGKESDPEVTLGRWGGEEGEARVWPAETRAV